MSTRILVTGAGGQLGRAMAAVEPGAVLLSRVELDVTDRKAFEAAVAHHRPQVIVHAAAWTAVDRAEAEPEAAWSVNEGGVLAAAAAAAACGAVLVYPSTDYIFDGRLGRPYREDDEPHPLSVYGASKLGGERAAREVTDHVVIRTSWIFGDGRNFVRAIVAAAAEHDEIAVVADQTGLPTCALHLAGGILNLLEAGARGTVHLAGGGPPCSWAELAEAVLDRAGGRRPRVRHVSTEEYSLTRATETAPRPAQSILDCSLARSMGVALPPWRDGLTEYLSAATVTRESGEA